jgi:hypothetical protein
LDKQVDIVCWAVPYPANYGGAIDVFYKIKALSDAGVSIRLHCFTYDKFQKAEELNKYCTAVFYYPRSTYLKYLFNSSPFIIASRKHPQLLENLLAGSDTIILEGLHSTAFAEELIKANKKVYLRTHNLEHKYYGELAKSEKNILKKLYYRIEAKRLAKAEANLNAALSYLHINIQEAQWFKNKYASEKHHYLAAFSANHEVKTKTGKGEYCLYHGNLSVIENKEAALFLIKEVFAFLNIPLIVCGMQPDSELQSAIANYKHISLIDSPANEVLFKLMNEAHIHVLYSQQNTGTKLKLLSALYNGRHVIANDNLIVHESFKQLCIAANTAIEYQAAILQTMQKDFTQIEIEQRKELLYKNFNNATNATALMQIIFPVKS